MNKQMFQLNLFTLLYLLIYPKPFCSQLKHIEGLISDNFKPNSSDQYFAMVNVSPLKTYLPPIPALPLQVFLARYPLGGDGHVECNTEDGNKRQVLHPHVH